MGGAKQAQPASGATEPATPAPSRGEAGTTRPWVYAPPRDGGRPLTPEVRGYFEGRFGESLGDVRTHEGPGSAVRLAALGADALATGAHVELGGGVPAGPAGRALVGHELAHALQARRPGAGSVAGVAAEDAAAEKEARAAGDAMAAGERFRVREPARAAVHLQRGGNHHRHPTRHPARTPARPQQPSPPQPRTAPFSPVEFRILIHNSYVNFECHAARIQIGISATVNVNSEHPRVVTGTFHVYLEHFVDGRWEPEGDYPFGFETGSPSSGGASPVITLRGGGTSRYRLRIEAPGDSYQFPMHGYVSVSTP